MWFFFVFSWSAISVLAFNPPPTKVSLKAFQATSLCRQIGSSSPTYEEAVKLYAKAFRLGYNSQQKAAETYSTCASLLINGTAHWPHESSDLFR
jgi:hypothetical protein